MRRLFAVIIIVSAVLPVKGQKQVIQDSLMAHFDLMKGKAFEALTLEDTSGALYNTACLVGKTVYVDFWFTTCAPCLKEIPAYKQLQQYFKNDSNIVFLSICIQNIEEKAAWKRMVKEKKPGGVQLFYSRNRPQKVNLLRQYNIVFPTYLLLDKEMKMIGYDAPRPSEKGWVEWALSRAVQGHPLSASYQEMVTGSKAYRSFFTALTKAGLQ